VTAGKLKALYPSHADYVAKVTADVLQLGWLGFYTRADGRLVIQPAERSQVP
jgi:putative methionine-R-sulfoxide reductase with GAF domain